MLSFLSQDSFKFKVMFFHNFDPMLIFLLMVISVNE